MLNFGLLDTKTPGRVANSFYEGQQQQRANALADYTLASKQREDQDAQATRNALGGADFSTPDSTRAAVQTLMQVNPKLGMELQKSLDERAKSQVDQGKTKADTTKQMLATARNLLNGVGDQASWTIWRDNTIKSMPEVAGLDAYIPAQFSPEKRRAMMLEADKLMEREAPKLDIRNAGGREAAAFNPYTGAQVTQGVAAVMSPAEVEANKLAKARLAQSADQFKATQAQGKVPQGYRPTADGNLQAIPGGPADLKQQGVFNQDTSALASSTASMDRLATAANEALTHPGLAGITGLRGAIPNIPGTEAADAAALLNTLKSQVSFGVLQDMRNNSKTGGALGQVSDAEGKRLEANLAALEKAQSLDQMKTSLKKIIDYSQQAKDRLASAYNARHKTQYAPSPAPSISTAEGGPLPPGYPTGAPPAPGQARPSLTEIFK